MRFLISSIFGERKNEKYRFHVSKRDTVRHHYSHSMLSLIHGSNFFAFQKHFKTLFKILRLKREIKKLIRCAMNALTFPYQNALLEIRSVALYVWLVLYSGNTPPLTFCFDEPKKKAK
jgi:hypothetical protein